MNSTSQDDSPDAPFPAEATDDASSRSRLIDTLIFGVNFSAVSLFALFCVISLTNMGDDPFEIIAASILLVIAVTYATGEFCAWFFRCDWLLLALGGVHLFFTPYPLFGLVSQSVAMVAYGYKVSLTLLLLEALGFSYLAFNAWHRVGKLVLRRVLGKRF